MFNLLITVFLSLIVQGHPPTFVQSLKSYSILTTDDRVVIVPDSCRGNVNLIFLNKDAAAISLEKIRKTSPNFSIDFFRVKVNVAI